MPGPSLILQQKLARSLDDTLETLQRLDWILQHYGVLTNAERAWVNAAQDSATLLKTDLIVSLREIEDRLRNVTTNGTDNT